MAVAGIILASSTGGAIQAAADATGTPTAQATIQATSTPGTTAGTATPPPLVWDKHLNDRSLLEPDETCVEMPCFHGIVAGKTNFVDALDIIRKSPLFSNLRHAVNTTTANWATKDGTPCCLMTSNPDTGKVFSMVVHVAPVMKLSEVLEKIGTPPYATVLPQSYSATEEMVGLVYPTLNAVIWVSPGDAQSALDANDPVVLLLYLDPGPFALVLRGAKISNWLGYASYTQYRDVAPVIVPTSTPAP
jgi:hypothetical protein